jgi:hypothetical protein
VIPYAACVPGPRWLAAAVALLLLLAVGFQLSLYSALAVPAAAPPVPTAPVQPAGSPAVGAALPLPVLPGDTRWGVGADTYCETFVEQELGLGNQGDTAFGAFLRLAGLGLVHPGPPPEPGDLVYFAPAAANQFDGHVGISAGDGQFTSVTDRGVQTEPLAGWDAPYLGWVRPTDVRTDRFGAAVSPR